MFGVSNYTLRFYENNESGKSLEQNLEESSINSPPTPPEEPRFENTIKHKILSVLNNPSCIAFLGNVNFVQADVWVDDLNANSIRRLSLNEDKRDYDWGSINCALDWGTIHVDRDFFDLVNNFDLMLKLIFGALMFSLAELALE